MYTSPGATGGNKSCANNCKKNPEGFTYTRYDGSIFEEIPDEKVTHDNNPTTIDADIELVEDGDDGVVEDGNAQEDVENKEDEEIQDDINQIDEDVDAPEEQEHDDSNDESDGKDNTVQVLVEDAEEVGVAHMDNVEQIHPEDAPTPTLPTISEISNDNILPRGRR